jgi:PqqD family protein of HPr-rel-A system
MPDNMADKMQDHAQATWRRDPALPFQRLDEEAIVVDPRTREVHLLNETAARIWDLLETTHSVADLCATLADEYEGAPPEALRAEVEAFVTDLGSKGLLSPQGRT